MELERFRNCGMVAFSVCVALTMSVHAGTFEAALDQLEAKIPSDPNADPDSLEAGFRELAGKAETAEQAGLAYAHLSNRFSNMGPKYPDRWLYATEQALSLPLSVSNKVKMLINKGTALELKGSIAKIATVSQTSTGTKVQIAENLTTAGGEDFKLLRKAAAEAYLEGISEISKSDKGTSLTMPNGGAPGFFSVFTTNTAARAEHNRRIQAQWDGIKRTEESNLLFFQKDFLMTRIAILYARQPTNDSELGSLLAEHISDSATVKTIMERVKNPEKRQTFEATKEFARQLGMANPVRIRRKSFRDTSSTQPAL